ncbi:MAG: hypothetical protein MJ252_21335, partial [archaeon]|nr:hypothetical protein [archaeon]
MTQVKKDIKYSIRVKLHGTMAGFGEITIPAVIFAKKETLFLKVVNVILTTAAKKEIMGNSPSLAIKPEIKCTIAYPDKASLKKAGKNASHSLPKNVQQLHNLKSDSNIQQQQNTESTYRKPPKIITQRSNKAMMSPSTNSSRALNESGRVGMTEPNTQRVKRKETLPPMGSTQKPMKTGMEDFATFRKHLKGIYDPPPPKKDEYEDENDTSVIDEVLTKEIST